MSDNSSIEWTDATWNPVTGCTKVSPGCDNCYAERIVERFKGKGAFEQVTLNEERLNAPLHWRKPRRVFVNSMSDLFHDAVPTSFIARVFSVMARTQQHTYQLLTKRHGRMRSLLDNRQFREDVGAYLEDMRFDAGWGTGFDEDPDWWPLPNVWLGVSVEDQKWADIRIPALLDTPAAVRFLSCEPLLGPIQLPLFDEVGEHNCAGGTPESNYIHERYCGLAPGPAWGSLDWVIVGGESGPGARSMHPNWARSLRDQCTAAGVSFFFKQWGAWAPNGWRGIGNVDPRQRLVGEPLDDMGHREVIERMSKHAAGRELDGRTWDEYPEAVRRG